MCLYETYSRVLVAKNQTDFLSELLEYQDALSPLFSDLASQYAILRVQ
jgi:hypothetical protein